MPLDRVHRIHQELLGLPDTVLEQDPHPGVGLGLPHHRHHVRRTRQAAGQVLVEEVEPDAVPGGEPVGEPPFGLVLRVGAAREADDDARLRDPQELGDVGGTLRRRNVLQHVTAHGRVEGSVGEGEPAGPDEDVARSLDVDRRHLGCRCQASHLRAPAADVDHAGGLARERRHGAESLPLVGLPQAPRQDDAQSPDHLGWHVGMLPCRSRTGHDWTAGEADRTRA